MYFVKIFTTKIIKVSTVAKDMKNLRIMHIPANDNER